MKRRAFLGFLGAAPAAAKAAGDAALRQMGFLAGSDVVGAAPPIGLAKGLVGYADQCEGQLTGDANATLNDVFTPSLGPFKALRRWISRNGVPAWKMRQLADDEYLRGQWRGLDPDLAVLRSVAPSWKAIKQRQRNLDRAVEISLNRVEQQTRQFLFQQKSSELFGGPIDWWN
jgi:hypothetical protein